PPQSTRGRGAVAPRSGGRTAAARRSVPPVRLLSYRSFLAVRRPVPPVRLLSYRSFLAARRSVPPVRLLSYRSFLAVRRSVLTHRGVEVRGLDGDPCLLGVLAAAHPPPDEEAGEGESAVEDVHEGARVVAGAQQQGDAHDVHRDPDQPELDPSLGHPEGGQQAAHEDPGIG